MRNFKIDIRIKIYCTTETNTGCETYGSLYFNIGNRPENQNIEIWRREESNYITTTRDLEYYLDPEPIMFQEIETFMSSTDEVTFTGEFKESDPSSTFDILAIITGKPNAFVRANQIYNTYQTERFSEGANYVEIVLRLTYA